MENIKTQAKWPDYLAILGILGLLGFFNPYFSSLGALSAFYLRNSPDPKLRNFSLLGYLGFIGPIILILTKLMDK